MPIELEQWLDEARVWVPLVLAVVASTLAVIHALLNKRDPRAALGWVAVCVVSPFVGPILYYVFGINRVRIRARRLEQSAPYRLARRGSGVASDDAAIPANLAGLAQAADTLAAVPLVYGNTVRVLHNGEQAYPAMLAAIDAATRYIYLTTYIFETDATGREFIDALGRAAERGVDVRVLIDGIGDFYAWPRRRAGRRLRRRGVRVGRFLAPRLLPPALRANLRNHRKILIVDGGTAFTGGMNIAGRHCVTRERRKRVADIHFALRGPVVEQMEAVFATDWAFVTGQSIDVSPSSEAPGEVACRVVDDGPTEDTDRLAMLLVAAVASAQQRVLIMTPYFLPSPALVGALQSAALRGLDVSVVLPARNNLLYVHWASRHGLHELMARGVKIYYQPPPFNHSKLFVIDDGYAVIGSANIDPRSLRLNFELAVEIYHRATVAILANHVAATVGRSRHYTHEDLDARRLPARLRDAVLWLFTPYL